MPKRGPSGSAGQAVAGGAPDLAGLEDSVGRLVAALLETRRRRDQAVKRARESESLLRQFGDGSQDPATLVRRVAELESENAALRARLESGRERVDEILARIRFLEERR